VNQPPRARKAPARPRGERPPSRPSGGAALPLRLAIGRDGLGLELGAEVEVGPLVVTELAVSLPKVKFPVDVSGGVARFRHRRGELLRMSLELDARRLERILRERLRGLLGTTKPDVWVGLAPSGATVALASDRAAIAFDVLGSSTGEELRFFVTDARGIGLPRPAVSIALEAIGALLGDQAKRFGSSFVIDQVATRVARLLLPDAGVRVPDTDAMHIVAFTGATNPSERQGRPDAWLLHLSRDRVPLEPSARVAGVAQTTWLLQDCDDALARGDLAGARTLALGVLTRAPRHAGACARLADIDRVLGDRSEGALAFLGEAFGAETLERALLRAELLAQAGDANVAANAFAQLAETDPAPLLGARAFERAAELARDAEESLRLLDRAIARVPTLTGARFRRLEKRLELGRLDDAFADAEELEAQAATPRARYDVWRQSADLFLRAGLRARAGQLYERSLRFVPDDAASLAGLGRALVAQGKVGRGARLLTRAVDMFPPKAEAQRVGCLLDLARTLATALGDRPAAIARLEGIADGTPGADAARALEARYRTDLGDIAGAAFAWARLRNAAESLAGAESLGERGESFARYLLEAARFELEKRGDAPAAQRHIRTALRFAPHDAEALALFRHAGGIVAAREGAAPAATPAPAPAPEVPIGAPMRAPEAEEPPAKRLVDLDVVTHESESVAEDEALAEQLTRKLQADPTDDAVADELIAVLMKLGRSHEVFALISARVDEAPPERRGALRSRQREILGDLVRDARARGNDAEAQLFESFATGLDSESD
jgi:tetratricopeptide (TPR) repeat protein